MKAIPAYAYLNVRMMPLERGDRYEDPLDNALEENGLGAVTGGGTSLLESGEIEYCGIDLDLFDLAKAIPFVGEFLTKQGAPKGSKLQYEVRGKKLEEPFGKYEGLAIYLNGTDLPQSVYDECDVNELYAEINRLLGERGSIQGHWRSPTETALYLYGDSAEEMHERIAGYLAAYPLCQRARLVRLQPPPPRR